MLGVTVPDFDFEFRIKEAAPVDGGQGDGDPAALHEVWGVSTPL